MNTRSPLQLSASFKNYYDQLRDPTSVPTTTPLHVNALNGDCDRVSRLLSKKGVDPNSTDQTGCTALNHAALLGHVDICALLIASGANVNAAGHDGSTPLHKAAQGGCSEVVKLLLREGADPLAVNMKGESSCTIASHRNHIQVVLLLCNYSEETHDTLGTQ